MPRVSHLTAWAVVLALGASAVHGQIDEAAARAYFDDVRELLEQDAGQLWGVPLYGPMLLVDPETRRVIANLPDGDGALQPSDGVYVGTWPAGRPVANTAVEWSGTLWAMIASWDPDAGRERTNVLFVHELWHRVQERIGLAFTNPPNDHLEAMDGRIWLRLETRALRNALTSEGDERHRALSDALLFRAYRHSLYEAAAVEERALENHEGLAEYTGIVLAIRPGDAQRSYAADALRRFEAVQSFARTFAYAVTPAYGLLLDQTAPGWTRSFSHQDSLPMLVARHYAVELPRELEPAALQRAADYAAASLKATEQEREAARVRRVAELTERFVEGPRLVLPLQEPQMAFDPRRVTYLGPHGRVYEVLEVSDVWGTLRAGSGALVVADWSAVVIEHHESAAVELALSPGWRIVAGEGPGQWAVRQGGR